METITILNKKEYRLNQVYQYICDCSGKLYIGDVVFEIKNDIWCESNTESTIYKYIEMLVDNKLVELIGFKVFAIGERK